MKKTYYHPIFGEIPAQKKKPDSTQIRSKRRDEKKRKKAAKNALVGADIIELLQAYCAGKISGEQATIFQTGPARAIRSELRKIQIQGGVGPCPWYPPDEKTSTGIPRSPRHTIRDRNGPSFESWLVDPQPIAAEEGPEIIHHLQRMVAENTAAHRMVDFLASRTSFSWHACREVVRESLYDADVVPDELFFRTIKARMFWNSVTFYQRHHASAVSARIIRPADGEWLLLPAGRMEEFLPGLKIPKMHLRVEYLIRVIRVIGTIKVKLEFYSTTYTPLFGVYV